MTGEKVEAPPWAWDEIVALEARSAELEAERDRLRARVDAVMRDRGRLKELLSRYPLPPAPGLTDWLYARKELLGALDDEARVRRANHKRVRP